MSSDKVLLTYKRKRFSIQNDSIHDTKETDLSPKFLRGSWISSPKSECNPNIGRFNNHHSEKSLSSICKGRYGFTETLQQHVPVTKVLRQSQINEQKDMGPMVLRSNRVLSSIKVENISGQATSPAAAGSQSTIKDIIQMDGLGRTELDYRECAEESSTALLEVHDQMGNPINLNVNLASGGGDSSGCPEVGAKMDLHSDNSDTVLCNDGASKEHSCALLITFSRRSKMRQDAGERITDKNLKVVEKLNVSSLCSSRVVGANLSCEGSSHKRIFEEQVNSKSISLENCVVPSSQIDVADEMANIKVDASSDYTSEACTGSKIQKSCFSLMPPVSAVNTCEELSKKFSTVQPVYVVKDYIFPLNTEPANSGNDAFISSVEESGRKLITGANNCENGTITGLSEERDSLAVPPSSVCQMDLNMEADERPDAALLENHGDSQSSSTPCCSIVFTDEENDARSKEIQWLESLDNVLREKKKDGAGNVINSREGFSSTMASKSAALSVSNQNIGIDFVNHLTASPEKLSPANLHNSSSEDQLKSEKSTSLTDFLGRYFPSNLDMPLDLNTAASPSGSHFRENFYIHDWKLPHSSNGNASSFKHKLITENYMAEMALNGKRGSSLSDKPKKYASEWSEEELDFLWIGVRRHGVDNWNAILRDPKLQFAARPRFPEDLASQWEREQKKLFNGILFPPARLSKPNSFSTPLLESHYTAKAHACAGNPQFAETKLSLGGVYLRKENAAAAAKSTFVLTYPPSSESSSAGPLPGSFLSMSSYPGAAIRHTNFTGGSRPMYQMDHGFHKLFRERSGNQQKQPVGLSAGAELPHWLKEACSSHPCPSDLPWPPFFTSLVNNDAGNCSPAAKNGEPLAFKDLRGRGILKRKSMASGKNSIKIEEVSASIEESGSVSERAAAIGIGASLQKNIIDLSNNIPVSIVPNDLVVLDSEASSEETISDDQNRRA